MWHCLFSFRMFTTGPEVFVNMQCLLTQSSNLFGICSVQFNPLDTSLSRKFVLFSLGHWGQVTQFSSVHSAQFTNSSGLNLHWPGWLARSSHSKFKLVWHQFSTVQFPSISLSGKFVQSSLGQQGQVPHFSSFSTVYELFLPWFTRFTWSIIKMIAVGIIARNGFHHISALPFTGIPITSYSNTRNLVFLTSYSPKIQHFSTSHPITGSKSAHTDADHQKSGKLRS